MRGSGESAMRNCRFYNKITPLSLHNVIQSFCSAEFLIFHEKNC